ncbi:unnamed protein product [Lathyrus oleraceus]
MKIWVLNTSENPKIKFWRCRNWKKAEINCDFFIWDDELDKIEWKSRIKAVENSLAGDCNKGEDMIGYLQEFGKESTKKFEKEYAKEYCSMKLEKQRRICNMKGTKAIG